MQNSESYKVLIIDDEPGNIEAIIECLNESNYKIVVATDGESGFEIAKKTLPNIIITDWNMPKLSGIETIKLFRSDEILKDIPIIMATGKMLKQEDLRIALDAGADDYIRKPIDNIELIARISSMITLYEVLKQNRRFKIDIQEQKEDALKKENKEYKNELNYFIEKMVQESKFNEALLEKIIAATKYTESEGKEILNDISNKFKLSSNHSYWSEFELVFKQVHKTFYDNLDKQFPDLSKNERRIAMFCKLNLTSKEAASITFQSELSLRKTQQRLREKLNLNSDISLNDFFQKL